jgi:asparagine synthase (glutamine-hydrolysing)
MRGIAGWLGTPLRGEGFAEKVAHAMRHRGPDARAIKSRPEATLIYRLLAGWNAADGQRGWNCLNRFQWRELYNHRQLRRYLETRGHVFKGHSDTAVLPHLYEEEGIDFIAKLRGMFALAMYDTRTLGPARDGFGIKPLLRGCLPG